MRFSTLIVSGSLAVLAAAAPAGTETSAAAPAQTTSAMDACLNKCPANDVDCKAHCIAVPSPNEDQANATTECSRKCSQGTGNPEDTKKFADCLAKCRNDHFYQTSVGTPEATGTPSNGGNSGNGGNNGGDSGNNSGNSSGNNGGDSKDGKDGDKSGDSSNGDDKDGDKSGDSSNSGNSNGDGKDGDKSGDSSNSGDSKDGDSKDSDSKDGDKSGDSKDDDKKSAASGLVASTAALFGAVVALLAL